jgi:hypothetical protein
MRSEYLEAASTEDADCLQEGQLPQLLWLLVESQCGPCVEGYEYALLSISTAGGWLESSSVFSSFSPTIPSSLHRLNPCGLNRLQCQSRLCEHRIRNE